MAGGHVGPMGLQQKSSDGGNAYGLDTPLLSSSEEWKERGAAVGVRAEIDANGKPILRSVKKGVKDFSFGRTLGEGSYSMVLAAIDRQTLKEYAVKVLDKRHIIKEKKVKYVNIEKNTLNRLWEHPGIVRLYYTFQDENSLYYVLGVASGGELLGELKKMGTFDVECTRFYGAQILDAIDYMHSRGVIHRDLKPENVLLDDQMHVKITDFGTAKLLKDPMASSRPGNGRGVPDMDTDDEDDRRATSFVGTAEYVSPELLTDKIACKASDLWAFGCIIYQLLSGRQPFKAANEYLSFQKIVSLDYEFPPGFPPLARDLVERLLVLDPSRRLSLQHIKNHEFFEGIDWGRGLWRQMAPRLKPYVPPVKEPTLIQLNGYSSSSHPSAMSNVMGQSNIFAKAPKDAISDTAEAFSFWEATKKSASTNVESSEPIVAAFGEDLISVTDSSTSTMSGVRDGVFDDSANSHHMPSHTTPSTMPTTISKDSATMQNNKNNKLEGDRMTIATDTRSIYVPEARKKALVLAFTREIQQSLIKHGTVPHVDGVQKIAASLPILLKEFSIELPQPTGPNADIQRDAATLVRRFRKHIANCFRDLHRPTSSNEDGETTPEASPTLQQFSVEEIVSIWNLEGSGCPDLPVEPPLDAFSSDGFKEDDLEDFVEVTVPEFSQAREFLVEGQAFKRLLEQIRVASLLTERKDTISQSIRAKIIEATSARGSLCQSARGRILGTSIFEATFKVSWSPVAFLEDQFAEKTAITDIITLTGTANYAQAISCASYMRQTWPWSGEACVKILQAAIDHGAQKGWLDEETQVEIVIQNGSVLVQVTGTKCALADIGEQFAWLSAACRTSGYIERLAYCTPQLQILSVDQDLVFQIDVVEEDLEPASNGICWHSLFRNAVIVKGYPILTRHYNETGLEVPLRMMAELGEATRVTMFNDQLLIKGFSRLLIPTARTRSSILWHLCFNKDGNRISYLHTCEMCQGRIKLSMDELLETRMFLGWTSSSIVKAGSANVDYHAIRNTGFNFVGPGCALEKVTLCGGMYITGGATFARGNKDIPLALKRTGTYDQEISWAGALNVVFYDVKARRGWLVDGASAILHLCRSQATQGQYSDCKNVLLNLHYNERHVKAAEKTLKDERNWGIVLFENKDANFGESTTAEKRFRFKDLVRNNWHILEQMQDHQYDILSGPGMPLRFTDRDILEGFGFVDIVKEERRIRPRVAMLEPSGRSWVDFTREIAAVTIMGSNFGELIVPNLDPTTDPICEHWRHIPIGKDYLVAPVSLLKKICENIEDSDGSSPLELAKGIYWHQGGKLFEPYATQKCEHKCDRVQSLLPEYTLGFKTYPATLNGNVNGAVVFGRSLRIPRFWPLKASSRPTTDISTCIAQDARHRPILAHASSTTDSSLVEHNSSAVSQTGMTSGSAISSPSSNTTIRSLDEGSNSQVARLDDSPKGKGKGKATEEVVPATEKENNIHDGDCNIGNMTFSTADADVRAPSNERHNDLDRAPKPNLSKTKRVIKSMMSLVKKS